MSKKKTNDEYVNQLRSINPLIVPLNTYENSHSKILFRCLICGREWEAFPYQELQRTGFGCAKCSHKTSGEKRRKTNVIFVEELKKKNPNITVLTSYEKSKQKVKCQCKLCGNTWEATPDKLLRGIGCPRCYHQSTSFIEQFIYTAFCFVLGENKVINRDKSAIGKELDIYIPSLNVAIEYGSWFWHKSRINGDYEKQGLCKEHNIRLIMIYDSYDEENVENGGDCYFFAHDLSTEKGHKTVKQIVMEICKSFGLDYSKLQYNWDSITDLAYKKARKITTADYAKLVKAKNSHNIEVLGEYRSSYDTILCRCGDCGYEWEPRANNLINENAGCPRCSGTIHYTNQSFISKVGLVNPDFELLEPYSNGNVSILCRCRKCGYEWKAAPVRLLKKRSGCPRCISHKHYSNEEFIEKLRTINPCIQPLEQYPRNNKTKLLCLCAKCGNQFSMRPNNLLSGQGCPNCANEKRIKNATKNKERFVDEISTINPNIITLEPYVHSKAKIACKCKKCGNEWKATPNSLLHGYGCPKCARIETAKKNKKRVLCVETNTLYDSLKEASAQSGFSNAAISMCCNGKKETVGGLHWKYV